MAQEIKKQETGGTATRYRDPFAEMRADMDRVFNSFLGRSFFGRSPWLSRTEPTSLATPNLDVRENENQFVFEADLPGIDDKDVEVVVRDGVLTLKGEKKAERDEKKDTYHLVERSYGRFERSFQLPDSADQEKIKAEFDKGVLRIIVPKRPEAAKTQKKIPIGKG